MIIVVGELLMNLIEIIGYIASILVAVSLTMSKILRLRVINLIGAIAFTIYGLGLGAYPIFFVNGFIVIIDIYYLVKMFRNRDKFDSLEVREEDKYLKQFYTHYKDDIEQFFPGFKESYFNGSVNFFILRNMQPVNLVTLKQQENGIVEVVLDYTLPAYRDFLNGKYLLTIVKRHIKSEKTVQLVTKPKSKPHRKYLKRIGFKENGAGLFVYKIT